MVSNVVSSATNIQYLDNIGIQINYSGSSVGSFSVQVSADYLEDINKNVLNPGHWVNLSLSPAPTASAAASSIYLDLNQLSAPWIRVAYTAVSGSGFMSSFITGKMV